MKEKKLDSALHQRLALKVGDPRKLETEEFKRSAHDDWATNTELKDRKYSGMRMNLISEELEIWVFGRIEARVPAPNGKPDEAKVHEAFVKLFATN